ncbi:intercompartmental signaling factor BofC [Bacillus timonensis]|nr:intercompartmental signaling factor BofC [Bacillus timonensis]
MNKIIHILMLTFLVTLITSFSSNEIESSHHISEAKETKEKTDVYEVNGPLTLSIILERIYLDGEVSEEIYEETIWSMEDFWASYATWELVHQDEEQIVFKKHIDDISPLLKSNGYFGISEEGVLTIFEGKPDKSTKVIQSFFQIDVKKLESHYHKELKKGIKIGSKEEYVKVIETFKSYSSSP